MTWPGGSAFAGLWTSALERGSRRLKNVDGGPACVWCEGPLGKSPSDDFCSQDCAGRWATNDGWQAA